MVYRATDSTSLPDTIKIQPVSKLTGSIMKPAIYPPWNGLPISEILPNVGLSPISKGTLQLTGVGVGVGVKVEVTVLVTVGVLVLVRVGVTVLVMVLVTVGV